MILSDAVHAFLETSIRQLSYTAVKPHRLSTMLSKLASGSQAMGAHSKAERRRAEALEVARVR